MLEGNGRTRAARRNMETWYAARLVPAARSASCGIAMRHVVGLCSVVCLSMSTSSARASLIGDSIEWDFALENVGSIESGLAVVVEPGAEASTTIGFALASLYEADLMTVDSIFMTDDSLSLSHFNNSPLGNKTIWTFHDLDWPGAPSRISDVTQTGGTAVDDISFTKDAITITIPDGSGTRGFDFDIEHRLLAGLEDDTFNWSFAAAVAGNLASGTATVKDPGVDASWTHPLFFDVYEADFASDTLTLRYPSGHFNSESTWTFTGLDFVYPLAAGIHEVTQIGGGAVNDVSFTESSITINLPEVHGPAEFTFRVTPIAAVAEVSVETITITHPGNAGDAPHGGYGSVDHLYDIGQFEITAGQYTEFLNAIATDDTHGLYNPDMWDEDTGCKIWQAGSPGGHVYSVAPDWEDRPVNFVSWGDAARFCNWLHNGQPTTGTQDLTTTEDGSYFLNGATTDEELIAITREPDATWVLPSEDEWYKSAYHNNDGATANYWDYPTGSDTAPSSEAPPGFDMDDGSANFNGSDYAIGAPYYRTDVGAYDARPSVSPYGTFDQGGNVFEWSEGIAFVTSRVSRGGAYYSSSDDLRSWNQSSYVPTFEWTGIGFRVARLRNDSSPCIIPERLGGLYTSGFATNLAIEDNIAYLANGTHGLLVADVSDLSAPFVLSAPDMSTDASDVWADGARVYVTDVDLGLLIIDASTPTSPTLLGSYSEAGSMYGLTVRGTTAYVAAFANGLQIIDVSSPSTPILLGSSIGSGLAFDVAVAGNTAYVASVEAGLQIVDVSDPSNVTLLGSYDTPGFAVGVTVVDGVAYVADGEEGLQIIDVSDPTMPELLGTYDTQGAAINVVVEGGTAYVADGDAGLQIIDVGDPASPALSSWYSTPGTVVGLLLHENKVYVADGDFGVQIIEMRTPPLTVDSLGAFDTPSYATDVTVLGTTAYVLDGSGGLQVVDVSEPASPLPLGSYDTMGYASSAAVVGTTVYVADPITGLQIVDVSDPASPAQLGSYPMPSDEAYHVEIAGDLAFVASKLGLRIIDVSTPASPTLVGSYDTTGEARSVAVTDGTAYLAVRSDGLLVIDVSNPSAPVLLGEYHTVGAAAAASDVAVVGDIAYVGYGPLGLEILDVGDPANITLLGTHETPGEVYGMTAVGTSLYLADSGSGLLQVVDASDPMSPQLLGSHLSSYGVVNVNVVDSTAYIANGSAGLLILDVSDPCDTSCASDFNGDGQGDPSDHAIFTNCMFGPNNSMSNGCGAADLDADGDADLADFALLQRTFDCP